MFDFELKHVLDKQHNLLYNRYYSATIIVMSGASTIEFAIWIAAVVSLVNVLFTFVGKKIKANTLN